MGMEKQLVEKTNVYGNTVDAKRYARVMNAAVKEEYEKALVVSALPEDKGLMVRELAVQTAIPGPTVAAYLVELEHAERVQVKGYEGRDPLFIRPAA
jgi:DNA-binding transcriptional regulator YhcF (GntR family)